MQSFAKIVRNITLNVTQYHQTSFYSVVQVQSYLTICITCSQTTPFIFNYHKRVEMVIFHILLLFLKFSVVIRERERDKVFCGTRKNFCVESETLKLHSKTSLGSGLSVETTVMVIRCMNQFLLRQT